MSESPVSTYQYSDSFMKQGFLMLVIGIILIFVSFAIPPIANAAGFAIVFGIFNMVMYTNKDIIKIFENHLEIKTAPLAALKIIKFEDIKNVTEEKKYIIINLKSDTKPIKLHHRFLNKNEIPRVYSSLTKLTTAPV